MAEFQVVNNSAGNQFEIYQNSQVAYLKYDIEDSVITLIETQVPPSLEGRGIGSRLVKFGLDYARSVGLLVVLECSFARSYVQRHPEYQDLIKE